MSESNNEEINPDKTVHDDSSHSTNPVRKIKLYTDDENDMADDKTLDIKDVFLDPDSNARQHLLH